MSIKVGDKDLFPYLGDYRPVNIYKGEHKVAGWKWTEQSGKELLFKNTYNDFVEVEVDGKSYQGGEPSPENPIEIHSLNDFDVVSQKSEGGTIDGIEVGGRNLVLNTQGEHEPTIPGDRVYQLPLTNSSAFLGEELTFSFKAKSSNGTNRMYISIGTGGNTRNNITRDIIIPKEYKEFKYTFTASTSTDTTTLMIVAGTRWHPDNYGSITVTDIKLEKGNKATDWTPAPEDIAEDSNHPLIDKINLSLSEPLRSVGDVKDRLFRDSDGLWKVERNIGEFVADGSESVRASNHGNDTQTYHISIYAANSLYTSGSINITQSSHYVGRCWKDVYSGQDGIAMERTHLRVRDDRFSYDVNLFKVWLSEQHAEGNPLTVQYHIEPTIETLDQELQDKLNNLRSFQGSNYIYTMVENLKPTLHARLKVKDI